MQLVEVKWELLLLSVCQAKFPRETSACRLHGMHPGSWAKDLLNIINIFLRATKEQAY